MNFGILNSVNEDDFYFKKALLETLKSEGDTLILGYGYYCNNIFYPDISEEEKVKLDVIRNFEEEFYNCLAEGFKKYKNTNISKEKEITPRVIIVGHMKNDSDMNPFENYETLGYKIYYELKKRDIYVDVRVVKCSEKYHKKVAFKFYREKSDSADSITNLCPVMLLIGSSNLTRQGIHITKDFNQEVDVLFWNKYIIKEREAIIEDIITEEKVKSYKSIYNEFINKQREKLGKKISNESYEISKGISLEVYIYIASLREELDESKKSEYRKSLSEIKELLIDFYYNCIKLESTEKTLKYLYFNRDKYIQIIVKNDWKNILDEINSNNYIRKTLKNSSCYDKNSYKVLKNILTSNTNEEDVKVNLNELIYGKPLITANIMKDSKKIVSNMKLIKNSNLEAKQLSLFDNI